MAAGTGRYCFRLAHPGEATIWQDFNVHRFLAEICQGTEANPPNLPPQREADRSVSGRQSSHPKTFLQLPHRVAERRGRDIETRCRGSKAL
jgi:hypothetical protein